MRNKWIIVAIILSTLVMSFIYFASYAYFKKEELQKLNARATLYRSTLINALERYQFLPFILSKDPFVIKGTLGNDHNQLNQRLKTFSFQQGLEAIYLMNKDGITLASSNYDKPINFVGQNYGFRPYFKAAMQGKEGRFFGIGATTSRPGYFIARPVYGSENQIIGVLAIKLGLNHLQETWRESGERVFVSNKDGVVILSSDESLLYKTLVPLSSESRKKILAGRQFSNQPLNSLDWQQDQETQVKLKGETLLHSSYPDQKRNWRLHYLAPENRVKERAFFAVIIGAIALLIWMTIFATIRSERIRVALDASQKDRKMLQKVNETLETEIEERRVAERRLKKAQKDLAQASKLAALGQLSASVTHELGQPIAAMRNYLVASEFESDVGDYTTTIERLNAIVLRMENITKQLRFFAEPGNDEFESIDLRTILEGAKEIVSHNLAAEKIKLLQKISETPIIIEGNRLRLEQVLINLISNSVAAMETSKVKHLNLDIYSEGPKALIAVEDTGTGIANRTIEQLQEPFHTTRESGQGMGLGLAITAAIVKEHQGQLSVMNSDNGGARFTVTLPRLETI